MQPRFPPPFPYPPGQGMYPGAQPGIYPPHMGNPMFPMVPGATMMVPPLIPGATMMAPPPMIPGATMMAPGSFPMAYPGATMMMPGMMPGFPGARPIGGLAAQVTVGAPVMKAPTPAPVPAPAAVVPPPVLPSPTANSIAVYNAANAAVTEAQLAAANTSNHLHKNIFCNAYAGLPVTLYIGKVPLDFEDSRLSRLLEIFGKVSRFVRPADPVSLLPAGFAFVTYAQSICGLRCLNVLNGVNVDLEGGEQCIEIKTGVKDSNILTSVQNAETEAALMLPPGSSLKEIYEPLKENMNKILRPSSVVASVSSATKPVASSSSTTELPASTPSGTEGPSDSSDGSTTAQPVIPLPIMTDVNYYSFIDEELEASGEKLLMSEIEKYRMRQNQRDVEVEQIKRQRIKQRVKEIQEMKRLEQLKAQQQATTSSANNAAAEAMLNNFGTDKKREIEDFAEQEAKRRRKQEVLRMLSGDLSASSSSQAVEEVTAPLVPSSSGPIKVALSSNKPKSGSTLPSTKSAGNFGGNQDEEEVRPMREIIKLDYTPQELSAGDDNYTQSSSAVLAADAGNSADHDDTDLEGGFKKKKVAPAPVILNEAHAKALAQAQAISAALANKQPIVDVNDTKAILKQMIDKIPTQKDELFAYPVNWRAIEQHNIIEGTMRGWIIKKMVEYLGEEEESLTGFIVSKLNSSCKPQELVTELTMVLDEDAEQFVLKLWRMLIYYSLKP